MLFKMSFPEMVQDIKPVSYGERERERILRLMSCHKNSRVKLVGKICFYFLSLGFGCCKGGSGGN